MKNLLLPKTIGAPQFPELTLKFIADNKPRTFQIVAKNISEENKYIQKSDVGWGNIKYTIHHSTTDYKRAQVNF